MRGKMRKTAKLAILAILMVVGSLLTGCRTEDPIIVCGREWNPALQIVADTSSEFGLGEPLYIQFRYGTGFDFNALRMSFYEGTLANKGKEIWSHDARVSEKMSSYTLQGRTKHSEFMSARELTRHKEPGTVVIEISANGRVIVSKQIELVRK